MPRIDGRSARPSGWVRRRSPRPATLRAGLRSNPIVLLTSVTLTRFVSADFFTAFFAIYRYVLGLGPLAPRRIATYLIAAISSRSLPRRRATAAGDLRHSSPLK